MCNKIVFCGGGNMAEGILRGLLRNETAAPSDITVKELLPARCEYLKETYGVTAVTSADEAIKAADIVIIAVTPQFVPLVASEIKPLINEKTLVISIAAGVTIETVENHVGNEHKVVRVMPNTLNQSGNGYSAACMNANCDEQDKETVTDVLNALGQGMFIKEEMFNTFTAFCNVGPLWFYKTVETLIDAGVYVGFSRQDARKMVLKNMLGVVGVLEATGEHPAVKVDQMTSPGGITIEALKVLEDKGFSSALLDSVSACYNKVNGIEK